MTTAGPRTLCEAFQQTKTVRPDAIALRSSDGATELTWSQYADRVRSVAEGLHGLGVRRGEPVAIILANRPEFHVIDTAALHLGAVPFSLYATLTAEQIAFQLSNAGARVLFCEAQFAEKVRAASADGMIEHLVCVDAAVDGMLTLDELESKESNGLDFESAWQAVEPQDTLTIIYTSGTTGPPKGVELTHAGLLVELDAMAQLTPVGFDDVVVSYLSDAHIANRWSVHYTNLRFGIQVTTVADAKQLVPTLPVVRPTYFAGVPHVWYKIKAAVQGAIAAEPDDVRRNALTRAIEIGIEMAWLRSDGKPIPQELASEHARAEAQVFAPLRAKLGFDRLKYAVAGAAALAPDATAFLIGLGIEVCELWGMSETSAVVTANPPGAIRIGTVGKLVPGGGEIAIAADGEFLVRGPLVMKGYRNDPEKTAAAIDADGWMHTGDIARLDEDGYLTIVDRKKEIIINSGGKNMSPANIEGIVKASCPLIGWVTAIGDAKPYVTALITIDPDAGAAYADRVGLADASPAALAGDPGVQAVIAAGVQAANEKLARVEQIKKFRILPVAWEPGGDELTPTMKLKRHAISAKYLDEVERLYA